MGETAYGHHQLHHHYCHHTSKIIGEDCQLGFLNDPIPISKPLVERVPFGPTCYWISRINSEVLFLPQINLYRFLWESDSKISLVVAFNRKKYARQNGASFPQISGVAEFRNIFKKPPTKTKRSMLHPSWLVFGLNFQVLNSLLGPPRECSKPPNREGPAGLQLLNLTVIRQLQEDLNVEGLQMCLVSRAGPNLRKGATWFC